MPKPKGRARRLKEKLPERRDASVLAGGAVAIGGVAMLSVPAALILGGLGVIVGAVVLELWD